MSSGRLSLYEIEPHIDSILDEVGEVYKPVGRPINVYKFRQVSGYTIFTKNGEIPKYQSLNETEQFANFKTGKEPITVVWENSSNLKNSIEKPNEFKTEFKVGNYEVCYSSGEYSNSIETIEKEIFGSNFAVDIKTTNISVESATWIPDVDDQINYLYVIVDARYPSFQMLQLSSFETLYNDGDGSLFKTILQFQNINLKYSSTGRQILDFIQFGAIGYKYAFPKEIILPDGNVEVVLDSIKLESTGIQSIQIDTNTTTGFKGVKIFGSPIGEGDVYNTSQRLFLLDSLLPEESDIFYTNQEMNYFVVEGAKPVYKTYVESYKDNPTNPFTNLGSYNVGAEKKFLGAFEANNADIINSNPIAANGKREHAINFNDAWIKLKKKYDISKYVDGIQDVDGTTDQLSMKTTDFLNFISYVDFYTDSFGYEISEIIKFKATDVLGIFGSILNLVMGGIDLGWTKDKTLNLEQPMNFLVSVSTFSIGTAIRPLIGENVMIPLELFNDKKEQSLFSMDNVQLCSFHFSLTDYIQDTSQSISGAEIGKGGGNGIWNTKYIGQVLDEDNKLLLASGEMFKFNPRTTKAIPNPFNENQKYIIDVASIKQIYSGDCRFSAFVKDADITTNKFFNRSVYSSIFSTTSKTYNKFRWIDTTIKFNFWEEFNTIGSVPNTWPQLILPPSPLPITNFIWMEEIKYQSPLFEKQSIPSGTPITSKLYLTIPGTAPQYIKYDLMNKDIVYLDPYEAQIVHSSDYDKNYITIADQRLSDIIDTTGIQSIPNVVRNDFNFNLDLYRDEDLINFDRVAIQFLSENGQTYWMKIPDVDFIKLKNGRDIYIEKINQSFIFNDNENNETIIPIDVYSPDDNSIQRQQLADQSVFSNRVIKISRVFKRIPQFTLTNEGTSSSKPILILESEFNYVLKGVESPDIIREYFEWTTENLNIEVGQDRKVQDFTSSNSRTKILRVLLFRKDYDESSDITYIN